jgi:hypothetical protein
MEGYYKVKVKKGTKNGFTCKWSDKSKWTKTINFKKYNGAILTGSVNNLIVLDVDVSKKKDEVKADGITEFDKYIEQYGEPLTYKVKTPSGGFHYYFKFENSDIAAKQIIKDSLPNASGYRNAGLDIRTNGGLIIMAGSTIYNVGHYEVIRDVPLIEMPLTLLEWLTDAEANCSTTEKPQSIKKKLGNVEDVQRDYTYYDLTDEKIIEILTLLPAKYKDNYSDWLKVLTVMKHHNKKKLWDKYSKGSYHYNKAKNYSMWDRNKGIFNINYLVSVLRSMGHKIDFFKRYKAYEPITKVINNINKINCNYTYISEAIPYELYKQHNTIILQSSTGTGKTTAVAALVAQSMEEYEDLNFLSITTRTTLCDQHMTSFKNIDIQHYQTCTDMMDARH